MRTFMYCRVSTSDQTIGNQLLEAKAAGYTIEENRVLSEIISGSTMAKDRPIFKKLLERMEKGDRLIVSKLDRLGRNAIDVQTTIQDLSNSGVSVVALNLGVTDLTSPSGKLMLTMLAAVAEMERDLIIERTKAGLERAKSEGKKLGRPKATDTREKVQQLKAEGLTQVQAAFRLDISTRTVKRHWV